MEDETIETGFEAPNDEPLRDEPAHEGPEDAGFDEPFGEPYGEPEGGDDGFEPEPFGWEPEANDYEQELEARIAQRLGGYLQQAFAPIFAAQAVNDLGGEAAAEYLAELTPQERLVIAQIPGVARAIRDAAAARGQSRPRAPRSEAAYAPDDMRLSGSLQREIDAAFPAYAEAFGVTKTQFTKMVLERQGGR
jgi:hypothetical protein